MSDVTERLVEAELRRRVMALGDRDLVALVERGVEHDWTTGQAQRLIRARLLRALGVEP
jgi:hypothetical protein